MKCVLCKMTHMKSFDPLRRLQAFVQCLKPFLIVSMAKAVPPLQGGTPDSVGDPAIFGVLTVSDRASKGIYDDESGPAILNFFYEAVKSEYVPKAELICNLLGII